MFRSGWAHSGPVGCSYHASIVPIYRLPILNSLRHSNGIGAVERFIKMKDNLIHFFPVVVRAAGEVDDNVKLLGPLVELEVLDLPGGLEAQAL